MAAGATPEKPHVDLEHRSLGRPFLALVATSFLLFCSKKPREITKNPKIFILAEPLESMGKKGKNAQRSKGRRETLKEARRSLKREKTRKFEKAKKRR